MSAITIEFEVTKWHVLALLAAIIAAVAVADVDLSVGYHDGRDIRVMVEGQARSLQEAIDSRTLPCGSAPTAETADRAAYATNAELLGGRRVSEYCS